MLSDFLFTNNDIGKWSVKKINSVNVKKILLFECDTDFESKNKMFNSREF